MGYRRCSLIVAHENKASRWKDLLLSRIPRVFLFVLGHWSRGDLNASRCFQRAVQRCFCATRDYYFTLEEWCFILRIKWTFKKNIRPRGAAYTKIMLESFKSMAEVCPKKACVDAILTVARDGARCTGRKLGLYRKPRSQQGLRINCVAHEEWIPQTRARRAT